MSSPYDLFPGARLLQANLWMNPERSKSNIHYDAYDNLLCIVRGKKLVRLFPPSASSALRPFPIYSKSANHSMEGRIDHVTGHEEDNEKHFLYEIEEGGTRRQRYVYCGSIKSSSLSFRRHQTRYLYQKDGGIR